MAAFFLFPEFANSQMYWNQAASFAGNNTSYITVPNSSAIDLTGSFSIEAWINPTSVTGISKGVISKGGTSLKYGIRITSSRLVFITNGAPRLSSKTTSLIPVNTWTHISATYSSASNLFSLYINGVLDTSSIIAGAAPTTNPDSLYLGFSGSTTPFPGKMDEVRLWNRELSAAEVNNNMRTSLCASGGIYNGLILSMTFQNPLNSNPYSFTDQSGNSNNGKGRNITQFDQSFRPLHTISQNESIKFSGNNDYLSGKDTSALTPSSSLTIEFWIYPEILIPPMTILKKGNSYEALLQSNVLKVKINGVQIGNGVLPQAGKWSHFIFSYDAAAGTFYYSINEAFVSGSNAFVSIPSNTDSLLIGGGISEGDFVGYLDEVRISHNVQNKNNFRDYMFTSIDLNNDPFPSDKNINYSFDGNTIDNTNEGGPRLEFRNNARFSNPGQISGQPVSPLNRSANPDFQKGFYLGNTNLNIPSIGSISDEVRINKAESINDINLFIALNHLNSPDLEIYLIAPNGDSVNVLYNYSSNSNDDNIITIFDDQSDSTMNSDRYNSLYTKIKPLHNLNSVFGGDNPQGTWKLRINDNESGSPGMLYAWGIQINNQQERDKNLNVTCIPQGFYDANTNLMVPDTITVNIRQKNTPFDLVYSGKELFNSLGLGKFSISAAENIVADSLYYLQIFHRNSIESWSGGFISFVKFESGGNMTFSQNSVFGSNSILVDSSPLRFAIYSGDVNQDGTIDASDLSGVENDVSNSVSGYVPADLNGDDFVDASDLSIVENNAAAGINVISP